MDQGTGSFVLVDTVTRQVVHGPGLSLEQVAALLHQQGEEEDREEPG